MSMLSNHDLIRRVPLFSTCWMMVTGMKVASTEATLSCPCAPSTPFYARGDCWWDYFTWA